MFLMKRFVVDPKELIEGAQKLPVENRAPWPPQKENHRVANRRGKTATNLDCCALFVGMVSDSSRWTILVFEDRFSENKEENKEFVKNCRLVAKSVNWIHWESLLPPRSKRQKTKEVLRKWPNLTKKC